MHWFIFNYGVVFSIFLTYLLIFNCMLDNADATLYRFGILLGFVQTSN